MRCKQFICEERRLTVKGTQQQLIGGNLKCAPESGESQHAVTTTMHQRECIVRQTELTAHYRWVQAITVIILRRFSFIHLHFNHRNQRDLSYRHTQGLSSG